MTTHPIDDSSAGGVCAAVTHRFDLYMVDANGNKFGVACESEADRVCAYLLRQITENANLHYYCGPGSEVFHRLVEWFASKSGAPAHAVERIFGRYQGTGEADVVMMRRARDAAENGHYSADGRVCELPCDSDDGGECWNAEEGGRCPCVPCHGEDE